MTPDASAIVELLLDTERGRRVAHEMRTHAHELHAPAILDSEVVHALRRLVRAGDISEDRGRASVGALRDLPIERHAIHAILPRVWDLRDVLSAYDATYVALAEVLGSVVLTCDERMARAHGIHAEVRVV